jgi:hypothetical protein
VAILALTATPSSAGLTPWDQEKVTALAGELHKKTQELRASVRREVPPTTGSPSNRAHFRFRDELQAIEATARRLHNALAAGEGQAETLPTYRRMIRSVRAAAEEIPRLNVVEPTASLIDAVAEVLRTLRPYYEETPII